MPEQEAAMIYGGSPAMNPELSKTVLRSDDILEEIELELRGMIKRRINGKWEYYQIEGANVLLNTNGIKLVLSHVKPFVSRNRYLSSYNSKIEAQRDVMYAILDLLGEISLNHRAYLLREYEENQEGFNDLLQDICSLQTFIREIFISYVKPASYRPVNESDKKFLSEFHTEKTEKYVGLNNNEHEGGKSGGIFGFLR